MYMCLIFLWVQHIFYPSAHLSMKFNKRLTSATKKVDIPGCRVIQSFKTVMSNKRLEINFDIFYHALLHTLFVWIDKLVRWAAHRTEQTTIFPLHAMAPAQTSPIFTPCAEKMRNAGRHLFSALRIQGCNCRSAGAGILGPDRKSVV